MPHVHNVIELNIHIVAVTTLLHAPFHHLGVARILRFDMLFHMLLVNLSRTLGLTFYLISRRDN